MTTAGIDTILVKSDNPPGVYVISSTLLVLPEDVRDKIFGLLPTAVKLYMMINIDPTYTILDPYGRNKKLEVDETIIANIHSLCSLYGSNDGMRAVLANIDKYVIDYEQNERLNIAVDCVPTSVYMDYLRCLKCKQCIAITIEYMIQTNEAAEPEVDLLFLHQIEVHSISLLDIYTTNPKTLQCIDISARANMPDIPYYYYFTISSLWPRVKRDFPDNRLLILLIDNTKKAGMRIPLTDTEDSYMILMSDPRYLTISLHLHSTLKMLSTWPATTRGELWQKYYNFVKDYAMLLEHSLIWPELIKDDLDNLPMYFVTKNVISALMHHFHKGNRDIGNYLCCYVVDDLIERYPLIIFDNTVINYISKRRFLLNPYLNIYNKILDNYGNFINN